ncbi:MAG: hypothetical protein ACE5Q6_04610 [Dehalococcoidia bacterium]
MALSVLIAIAIFLLLRSPRLRALFLNPIHRLQTANFHRFRPRRLPHWEAAVVIAVSLSFGVFLTVPFWIDGGESAIGTTDDAHLLLTSYMTSHLGSVNWIRSFAGGNDSHLLAGSSPWTASRLYLLLLEPWLAYAVITVVNVTLVAVFTWKLQVEMFGMSRVTAFLGTLTLALVQGYWAGKWPDAHVSNVHGLAMIPVLIYVIHRYYPSKYIYLITAAAGALYAMSTPIIFHNLPPALITLGLWTFFFRERSLGKTGLILGIFLLVVLLVNFEYVISLIQSLPLSARRDLQVPTVIFSPVQVEIITTLLLALPALGLGLALAKNKDFIMAYTVVFAALLLVPTGAYLLQQLHLVPYRWELLYLGNHFIYLIPTLFLLERLAVALYQRYRFVALWAAAYVVLVLVMTNAVILANSMMVGFRSSFPNDGWDYVSHNQLIETLLEEEAEPFRVLNYGTDPDIMFLGWYQGVESAGGYANLISQTMVDYWRILRLDDDYDVRVLAIEENQERNLAHVRPKLLKLLNVKYVFSKLPLNDPHLELYRARLPDNDYCPSDRQFLTTNPVLDLPAVWREISCIRRNQKLVRPLFVYQLQDYLPRAYVAPRLRISEPGFEFSEPDSVDFVGDGNAILSLAADTKEVVEDVELGSDADISILRYDQDQIRISVDSLSRGFVIVSENINPYLNLTVNGESKPLYPVNLVQSGFFIDQGSSEAVLAYCPPLRRKLPETCNNAD